MVVVAVSAEAGTVELMVEAMVCCTVAVVEVWAYFYLQFVAVWLVKSTECRNCHAPMEVALSVVALSVATVSLLWGCLPTGDCSGAAKIFGEVEGEVFAGISVEDFDWNRCIGYRCGRAVMAPGRRETPGTPPGAA